MNNTLTKAEKDRGKATETKADTHSNQDTGQTTEEGQAGGGESLGGGDTISGHKNTTAASGEDKYIGSLPGKTESEGRHEEEPEERNSGTDKGTLGSEDRVGSKEPDNSLNTVERQEPELGETPGNTQGSRDTGLGSDKTDPTGTSGTKDKGQQEKERKELQVNGKRDPDKVGPNDTKQRAAGGEVENTVEVFNMEVSENGTVGFEAKERQKSNNSIGSPDGRRARVNVTQYTMYRAGGEEGGSMVRTPPKKEGKTEEDPAEERRGEREKERKGTGREEEANLSFRGEALGEENPKWLLTPPDFSLWLFLPRRDRLPSSAPPLPRLPPGDARGGAGDGGVLL